nr:MAG TPA: hypothetical protein [Caudoviricetes sp.]
MSQRRLSVLSLLVRASTASALSCRARVRAVSTLLRTWLRPHLCSRRARKCLSTTQLSPRNGSALSVLFVTTLVSFLKMRQWGKTALSTPSVRCSRV